MNPSQEHSNSESLPRQEDPFVPVIIESLRARGHLAALPEPRPRAWDRAKLAMADPDDEPDQLAQLRISWRLLRRAKGRRNPELFEHRMADFERRLAEILS